MGEIRHNRTSRAPWGTVIFSSIAHRRGKGKHLFGRNSKRKPPPRSLRGGFCFAQPRISKTRVKIRKRAPIHLVARASLASMVLALFLARKESATPPMAPESPALLPDWNSTIRIMPSPQRSCKTVMAIFKTFYLQFKITRSVKRV